MNKIGIDLVHIPTFEQKTKNNGNLFINKIFSAQEIESNTQNSSLAGKFAAKEAFIKAFNPTKFDLKDILVLKKENKPYIMFKNKKYTGVSISHDGEYATAIVIL